MEAQDIYVSQENFEILQPIFLVARTLGILPVRYFKNGSHYTLKKSLLYGIYSYVLTIFLTAVTLLGIINDLDTDERHSVRMVDKKGRFVTCCDISIVIIIVFFSTVTLPQKLKKLWNLLHCLNQIDSVIPLARQDQFRQASLFFMATVFVAAISLFAFDIVVWTKTTINRMQDGISFFRNYTTFYVLYLIVVTQEIFFWHLIFFIKLRISAMNRYLRCIGQEKRFSIQECGKMVVGVAQENIEIAKGISKRKKIDSLSLVEKITTLAKLQDKISEAVQSVNGGGAYGVHLILLSCLLHLIVTPYFLLTEISKPNGNLLFAYLQGAWILAHIVRGLIIIEPCQQCVDEHGRTSGLLCQLLTSGIEENAKKSLAMFAMQLNYCKIKFSPCGFFTIDRSLITSVAATITTYLVILYQFNSN